ncbi:MAG: hypothetical protein RLZZ312_1285 [Bacteroidota bacterium]|jgi:hypothetical protein
MSNSKILANRFREVILTGTWIANTNFKAELDGIDYSIANATQQGCNTIAVIAQHIHYYIKGINDFFETSNLDIKDKFSFDFEAIKTQQEWETFLSKFWTDAEIFAKNVELFDDNKLNTIFVKQEYSIFLRNIDGIIEHSYYHLGQIILLKKIFL